MNLAAILRTIWPWSLLLALATMPLVAPAEERLLAAGRLMLAGKYSEAAEIYRGAASEDVAGRVGLSRCLVAEGKHNEAVAALAGAPRENPRIEAELARLAFDRGDYPEAEERVKAALLLDSENLLAQWILGELRRTSGRLEEAFKADPFNVRVKNSLEVLDLLDTMETVASEHGVLRFDGRADRLLARYVARVLDKVYPDLCRQFGFRPAKAPLVEIFHESKGIGGHQWFSARMIGLPYLGAVAASSGHMLAMTSPNDPAVAKKFKRARVLKHELVHVITLQQTNFDIPHWYTEALAVWSEGSPRPQTWSELLVTRLAENRLFNLDSINFGFTRPASSDDWQLAYCQAELYLEYMLDGRDEQTLRDLLAAYRDGLTTGESIRRVFGMSLQRFEAGYTDYLKKLAAEMAGIEPKSQEAFPDLLQALRVAPDDANVGAKVAEGYLRRGAYPEALAAARKVLHSTPDHPLAT
ncbi:MAG: tetratricopeptide repeat protein [Rhodopirellula sp.]|nr:tetratricopeptide repeat protein [Rhodopirellula sp.]